MSNDMGPKTSSGYVYSFRLHKLLQCMRHKWSHMVNCLMQFMAINYESWLLVTFSAPRVAPYVWNVLFFETKVWSFIEIVKDINNVWSFLRVSTEEVRFLWQFYAHDVTKYSNSLPIMRLSSQLHIDCYQKFR